MPALRTTHSGRSRMYSGDAERPGPSSRVLRSRRKAAVECIVVSSDEEGEKEERTAGGSLPSRARKGKAVRDEVEVIVISDGEEEGEDVRPSGSHLLDDEKEKEKGKGKEKAATCEIDSVDNNSGPSSATQRGSRQSRASSPALRQAQDALAEAHHSIELLNQKVAQSIELITCPICFELMVGAVCLPDCGHTLCRSCLVRYLQPLVSTIEATGRTHGANSLVTVSPSLFETLSHGKSQTSVNTLRHELDKHLVRGSNMMEQVPMVCPTCHGVISSRPVPNYPVRWLVDQWSAILGHLVPPHQPMGALVESFVPQ
ncbi:hypothetical protein K523DRAFT_358212 [Schizophyllum commune Tattone D]|nr:hypothetical protein K523DRAFT_358212 [Schizophyllum commune Tattone D]